MKKITKSLIVLFGILAASCSTDDVEDRPVIQGVDAPVLAAPQDGSLYVLTPENATSQAERFVWSTANYGGQVQITYTVEMDLVGANFSNPQSLGSTISANQLSVSQETLNNAALAYEGVVVPFSPSQFEVRVKSTVGAAESAMYSNIAIISVTPYTTEAPKLYVVGGFQGASGYGGDWTPADAPPIAASGFGETDYEGYVYMNVPAPEFKLLPTNSGFEGDYGDDGSFSGGLAQEGESNILLSAPGYYLIKADTETLTYTATPTSWGIIGSATPTGWDSDTDMTYDMATKTWTIVMDLIGGQMIKFRSNDNWDLNYGDDGADGMLEQGGADIPVAASGTYTITLDLSNPRDYSYTATLN